MHRRTHHRLRLEGLESREMLSAVTVESEPNDRKQTADPIQFDPADSIALVSGMISGRHDQDFFRFRAAAAGSVDLGVTSANRMLAKVSIEDQFGRKLLETEPKNGVNSGSFRINVGQEIFIRVRPADRSLGEYKLTLSMHAPLLIGPVVGSNPPVGGLFTEMEGNNTKAQANRFELGGTLQIQGTSTSDKDNDFFVFKATTSGTLNLRVSSTGSGLAKFSMEDSRGNKIFETQPKDGLHSGSVAITAGTTYYFRLRAADARLTPYLVDLALS